jgi:hypothetical protein
MSEAEIKAKLEEVNHILKILEERKAWHRVSNIRIQQFSFCNRIFKV